MQKLQLQLDCDEGLLCAGWFEAWGLGRRMNRAALALVPEAGLIMKDTEFYESQPSHGSHGMGN